MFGKLRKLKMNIFVKELILTDRMKGEAERMQKIYGYARISTAEQNTDR